MTETEIRVETAKEEKVYRHAQKLFSRSSDWVTFFREVLGLRGVVRQHYPTRESMAHFERTDAYAEIQQMLKKLREGRTAEVRPQELTRVITVRLPKSLHEALRAEAHEHRTSMNKLCISKLVQFIDNGLIPEEQ